MFRRLLLLLCLLSPLPAAAQGLDGDWNGTLDTPSGAHLRLLFRFHTVNGTLQAAIMSADQNSLLIAADSAQLEQNQLTVSFARLNRAYRGTWDATAGTITGNWTQSSLSMPLKLVPGTIAPRRMTRTPEAGDITLITPTGTLAGSLLKAGDGKSAAIVLTGSGGANRNGDTMVESGHGTYLLIARALGDKGISSLRIDKRGVGESAGAMSSESDLRVQTYAEDAVAWAAELKKRAGARCVWLIGHSEGALIAELAATSSRDICGIVMLAGMGRKPGAVIREQLQRNLPEGLKQEALAALGSLEAGRTIAAPSAELMELFRPSVQPYLISQLNLDPAALLAALKVPVLILQGDADVQVSVADARALAAARPDATLKILPGVNHRQRLDSEGIEAGLAPGIMDAVAEFIHRHGP